MQAKWSDRHWQLFAVAVWMSMMPIAFFATLCCLNPFLWPYIVYARLWSNVQEQGGGNWRSPRLRRFFLWYYFRDYFPVKLRIEQKLDASRNYLMTAHPHGILPLGLWTNFATDTTDIDKRLPGMTPHLCTLDSNFKTPLLRELFLMLGMIPVSEKSIRYVLNKGPGNYAIDVPGGSQESLDQKPGTARITIKKRTGIFRIALEEGVQLVPVFSFGESNLWSQVDNSQGTWLRTFQIYGKQCLGMSPTLFYGKPYDKDSSWGFLPYRTPITTIIGRPLPLAQAEGKHATDEEIEKLRTRYIHELQELYNRHKEDLAPDRKEDMRIMA